MLEEVGVEDGEGSGCGYVRGKGAKGASPDPGAYKYSLVETWITTSARVESD